MKPQGCGAVRLGSFYRKVKTALCSPDTDLAQGRARRASGGGVMPAVCRPGKGRIREASAAALSGARKEEKRAAGSRRVRRVY